MLKKWTVLLIVINMTILLGGMVSPSVAVETEGRRTDTAKIKKRRVEFPGLPEHKARAGKYQELFFYILGPEDVIKITVWGHPELSGELTVAPDGTISLPLTGDTIRVDGLTREEVVGELIRVMDKYTKHPRVTVNIVAYNSKVYYVLGEVGRPGKFSMEKTVITLRDALIKAGLPTGSAALGSVHIITPDPEKPTYTVVNASKILYEGKLKHNIVLKTGDVVYVPRNVLDKTTDILNKILGPARAVAAAKSGIGSW